MYKDQSSITSMTHICHFRFVSKIEGNAVEEGEKVFFEGIVDAQPVPSKKIKIVLKRNISKKQFI
jgi:hypothetical protein